MPLAAEHRPKLRLCLFPVKPTQAATEALSPSRRYGIAPKVAVSLVFPAWSPKFNRSTIRPHDERGKPYRVTRHSAKTSTTRACSEPRWVAGSGVFLAAVQADS